MDSLTALRQLYDTLCRHCDSLFAAASKRFPHEILCRPGCAQCCRIETVTPLEAWVIESTLQERPLDPPASETTDGCSFLREGTCLIYPVRPVICRTHGLMLYDSESGAVERTCLKNFTGLQDSQRVSAVDTLKLTENLLRLNMAFLQLRGDPAATIERVALRDLAARATRVASGQTRP